MITLPPPTGAPRASTLRPLVCMAMLLALAVGACASSTTLSTASVGDGDSVADGSTDGAVEDTVSATPIAQPSPTDADEPPDELPVAGGDSYIIGRANMGGEVVNPVPHPINALEIMESFPEQLGFTFMAGDVSCLAADATATATGDQVIVELVVGITTDAMTRSCLAGTFEHRMSIALDEGLLGREVVTAVTAPVAVQDPTDAANGADEPPPQAFETTLIGMSAGSAQEAAESFGYVWRVMALDGEQFVGTMDMVENRINVAIENGVVVDAWLG